MRFRVYGHIKDSETNKGMTEVIVKLYLGEEEFQKGKSAENGFYEIIAEIDDSRIESGQQLSVTFEKEGFEKQEHRLLTTEDSVNLDVKLKIPPPEEKKKSSKMLLMIIAGGAVILLLIIGIVVLLLTRPKSMEIKKFSADPNTIESGQSARLTWKVDNAESVQMLIDQNLVSVESDGNMQVQPTQTTEYRLIAKDKEGKELPKSLVVEVKDIIAPELTVTLNPSEPTSAEKVIFTANATDSGGINRIEILVNDEKVMECTESPCTYESGPFLIGTLSYEVHAWDNSDNKTTAGPESINILDAGAPNVAIDHSPLTPNTGEKVTFTASASDPGGIAKVQVFVNGKKVEECTGSPCKYTGGPYSLGSVSYEARAWDMSDNEGIAGPKVVSVSDIGAPDVTITHYPLQPNTKESVTFTAIAKDETGISRVQIYVKNERVKECAESPCKYTGGPYSLGSVSYEAHAWDKSNNKGVSGTKSLTTRDIGAPDVTISLNPSSPTTEERVTFTAGASDPGGIARIQIFVNGEKVEECTGSPCKYTGGPYSPGSVSYEAHAWDNSNNKGVAGPKSFATRDVEAPSVTISANPAKPTMSDRVTFTANATDPGGVNTVQIFVNGKKVEECAKSPCTYSGGPYSPGSVSYEAYAWDNSNNKGVSGMKGFTTTDTGAPDVAISPDPTAPTSEEEVTFTATARDEAGIDKVQIYVKGEKVKECTESPCIYKGGPYSLGTLSYEARARDKSGNEAVAGPDTITVKDIREPEITITHSPISPTIEKEVTIIAEAKDPGGINRIKILVNSQEVKECKGSPCRYKGGPYSLGIVKYEAHAWDNTGNEAVAGPDNINIGDDKPPRVTITFKPDAPTIEDKVMFTATATDPGGVKKIEILINGTGFEECTESPCTYEGGEYSLGTVRYEAHAWDESENKGVSGVKTFNVGDNKPPIVVMTYSPTNPTITQKVDFTAAAEDPSGISKIQIFVNGANVKECTESPCSYEGGEYSLGTVRYESYAWDEAGNKGVSGAKSFSTKDNEGPKVDITISPASPTITQNVTFTATGTDPGGIKNVQILVNGQVKNNCYSSPCKLTDGPYPLGNVRYEAYAWDASNNKGVSGTKSFSPRDVEAPKVDITISPPNPTTKEFVNFTATATDPGGIRNLKILINQQMKWSCSSSPCTFKGGPYPLGTVEYVAQATDNSGKTANASKSFSPRDVDPPVVNISTKPSSPTSREKVAFTATATDASKIKNINIYVNNSNVQTCLSTTSCTSNYFGPYGTGTNVTYKAIAWDIWNNQGQSPVKSFSPKDVDPPTVSVSPNLSSPNSTHKLIFTAKANDPSGMSRLKIYVGGKMAGECLNTSSCTTPQLGPYNPGNISYYAEAHDKLGNKASTTTKSLRIADGNLPTVSISMSPLTVNINNTVTFTATASDKESGIGKIWIYHNGGRVNECLNTTSCTYKNTYRSYQYAVTYSATAWDKAGNSKSTGTQRFTVMNYNFGTGNTSNWTPVGTAFQYQNGYISSGVRGDSPQGTLTSSSFYIQSTNASFLLGGGQSNYVGVKLYVGGQEVCKATGKGSDKMERVSWTLTNHVNKYGKLVIFDNSSTRMGHILFDDFRFDSFPFSISVYGTLYGGAYGFGTSTLAPLPQTIVTTPISIGR